MKSAVVLILTFLYSCNLNLDEPVSYESNLFVERVPEEIDLPAAHGFLEL